MGYYTQFYIYITVLGLTVLLGLLKLKSLDKGGRIFCLLLCLTFISEYLTYVVAIKKGNNMFVYHIYNPIELFILALYFNTTIETFRQRNVGIYIGIAGLLAGFFNSAYIQSIKGFNSYFLLFEGLCVISMSLFSFYQLMLKDSVASPISDPHFRLSFLLLFYWCITFISWGVYEMMTTDKRIDVINLILWTANIIIYLGVAVVFLLYKQKPSAGEYA